jgi:hypothetical protein
MKKIIVIGLLFIGVMVFASNSENNASQESNKTKKSIKKNISKSLMVNLDKLKKKNGLKGSNSKIVEGTIFFFDKNNEVSVKGWDNDEVSNKGICFSGTKRTLYRGKFRATITKEDGSVFESTHTGRNICISTAELREGVSLEVHNSNNKVLAEFRIERN